MSNAEHYELKIEHTTAALTRKAAAHEDVSKQLKSLFMKRFVAKSNIEFNRLLILHSTDDVSIAEWKKELQAEEAKLAGSEEAFITLHRKCSELEGEVYEAKCHLKDLKDKLAKEVG